MVCVVPVRLRPMMSFPHTKSNNVHDKISKSKTNPDLSQQITILCEIILSMFSCLVVSKL